MKKWGHSTVNNNIFFNILFFVEVSIKLKKYTFFDNLRIIMRERKMEITKINPFFHLLFLLYLLVTFISEFENTENSFSISLFWSVLVCKIPQYFAKHYWFGQLVILFQKVDTSRLLKIHIIFCLPAEQIPIFLGSSPWTLQEVEENFIPNLFTFLWLFSGLKK